jgi:hypothetical protein
MNEPVEITLARSLKLKNRLAGRLAKLDSDFENYNSLPAGTDRPDLKIVYAERTKLVSQLIELKLALNSANQSMQRTIFELGEAKSLVALLTKTSTKHGKVVEGYHGNEVEYTAQFRKGDIDREVRRLEVVIDRLQERLDGFNHRTIIPIDGDLLREIESTPPTPGVS